MSVPLLCQACTTCRASLSALPLFRAPMACLRHAVLRMATNKVCAQDFPKHPPHARLNNDVTASRGQRLTDGQLYFDFTSCLQPLLIRWLAPWTASALAGPHPPNCAAGAGVAKVRAEARSEAVVRQAAIKTHIFSASLLTLSLLSLILFRQPLRHTDASAGVTAQLLSYPPGLVLVPRTGRSIGRCSADSPPRGGELQASFTHPAIRQ